jgi:hypothetical protein
MTLVESQNSEELLHHHDEIQIISDPMDIAWQQGFEIEAPVFVRAGYVSSTEELAREYEKYLPSTRFILAKRDGEPGGSVRIVSYNAVVGFKTLDDIKLGKLEINSQGIESLANLPLEQTLEVGTLAVDEDLRGKSDEENRLAVVLFGAIYGITQETNCNYVIASFDEKFYRGFRFIFGKGVVALGPGTDYMGSKTVPALINVTQIMDHAKNKWPDMYNVMIDSAAKMRYD